MKKYIAVEDLVEIYRKRYSPEGCLIDDGCLIKQLAKRVSDLEQIISKDEIVKPDNWKDRVTQEYRYVKGNYNCLHKMLVKYEAGTLDFTPNCSVELLKRQKRAMGEYLNVLEIRAEIESIEL